MTDTLRPAYGSSLVRPRPLGGGGKGRGFEMNVLKIVQMEKEEVKAKLTQALNRVPGDYDLTSSDLWYQAQLRALDRIEVAVLAQEDHVRENA